jgi:hypothetical protein
MVRVLARALVACRRRRRARRMDSSFWAFYALLTFAAR